MSARRSSGTDVRGNAPHRGISPRRDSVACARTGPLAGSDGPALTRLITDARSTRGETPRHRTGSAPMQHTHRFAPRKSRPRHRNPAEHGSTRPEGACIVFVCWLVSSWLEHGALQAARCRRAGQAPHPCNTRIDLLFGDRDPLAAVLPRADRLDHTVHAPLVRALVSAGHQDLTLGCRDMPRHIASRIDPGGQRLCRLLGVARE